MIDINLIRENPELVKENIKKKYEDEKLKLVDDVLKLDKDWRELKKKGDDLRAERNKISKEINKAKKSKEEKKAKELIQKAQEIPKQIEKNQEKEKLLQKKIEKIMFQIPNIIHESVPIGKDDSENVEIKQIPSLDKIKKKDFEIKHHAEIAELIEGVDFDSARETSGNGFYYLTGDLALMHSALLAFARDYMVKKDFNYVIPPFMIHGDVVNGVMSFQEKEVMMYKTENEDLYLIGTSEHSMIGRFIDKKINGNKLPITLTSYSPCFRKEVGSHGIEEKGLYRLHQFEKQEMIVICNPEESYDWYEKMLQYTVDVFKQLKIPVRILECCSGDLADLKAKSADVEAWSPRQKKYWEAGSCSNLTDAQARRLNIRIEHNGKIYFAHTLNNTVLASPRALIAILENHQNSDGSVNIPKVLQPYMQGKKIIKAVKKPKKAKENKNSK